MLTSAEKKYLALTLCFLALGAGLKTYRHLHTQVGLKPNVAQDSARAEDSASVRDSSRIAAAGPDTARHSDSASPRTDSTSMRGDSAAAYLAQYSPEDLQPFAAAHARGHFSRHGDHLDGHEIIGAHQAARKTDFTGKVSLNSAAAQDLMRIKGVGEKTAQAIIEYRQAHGPFHDLRQLQAVKGIGEKKLEKIRPFLIL